MDVDNHQWNTSSAGGEPSLTELQDLPDHKLRQKNDIMTGRYKFCHQPGHPIKHCPMLYARDPFIAPFNLWNDHGWVRLEHHVANVNVSDVLEDDDLSDKPYHSSGSGHSSDTDGSYAPRIGNADTSRP
ncbi:hypothetical protein RI367_004292 [Sorochytrium milnesiophthora]